VKLPDRSPASLTADEIAALCRADPLGAADVVLRSAPGSTSAISTEQRDQLLAKCAAGEYVELVVEFTAYEQRDGESNRNYVRFADKAIGKLAKSGKGIPLLRDHDEHDLMARAGTVLEVRHDTGADGTHRLAMTAKVTAPWAVEALLRGNIDRFSIHARPTGPVLCSVCNAPVGSKCWHFPGDTLAEVVDGDGNKSLKHSRAGSIRVEWIFTAAELVETSAVSVPAVPAARIETVRAAMLAARGINAHELDEPAQEDPDMTMIALALMASALGLPNPTTATADQVEAAARSQTARVTALEAANREQTSRLAAQEVSLSAIRDAAALRDLEEFVASEIAAGRVVPGSATEKSLRAYFATNPTEARALAAGLPRVTPAGAPRQSAITTPAAVPAGAGTGGGASPTDPAVAQLGAVNAEIENQGATPTGVLRVLSRFGAGAGDKIAKHGAAAFGLPTGPG
jgi:hypothetical protein